MNTIDMTSRLKIITRADVQEMLGRGSKLWDYVANEALTRFPNSSYDRLYSISELPITLHTAEILDINEAFYKKFEGDIVGLFYDYISGNSGGYLGLYPAVECDSVTGFLDSYSIKEWDDEDPFALYSNNRTLLATFAYTETAYAMCDGYLDAIYWRKTS